LFYPKLFGSFGYFQQFAHWAFCLPEPRFVAVLNSCGAIRKENISPHQQITGKSSQLIAIGKREGK
jgi:hypothetical protein